jgi:hypothetical protein
MKGTKMKLRHLAFLFASTASLPSHGAGVGGAVSNSSGSYEKHRLCTDENKEEYFYKNACTTIMEQMRNDQCTAPLLKQLIKRLKDSENGNPQPNQEMSMGGLQCRSQDDQAGWKEISKNDAAVETVLLQFFISLANARSNLDTFNNLSPAPGADNSSATGGYMNLSLKQMDDPKYNKGNCGCHNTNSEGSTGWFWFSLVGPPAFAADLTGRSPGPRDDHHSVQCAVHMAITEAVKDGTLFSGSRKSAQNPKPEIKGAAKIFDTLQDWESTGQPKTQDPNDPDVSDNPKLNAIVKNVRDWCRKNVSSNGSITHKFSDDFDVNGNLRTPGTR